MRLSIIICLVSGLLFFNSCSFKQNQALFEQKGTVPDSAFNKNATNISNYRIKPQDILQITNIQNSKYIVDVAAGVTTSADGTGTPNPSQGETYQVEEDGTIPLTGIGRVKVTGLTRVEARKYIEELYSKASLRNPLLELKIINLKVNVLGEAKTLGPIPLTKDRTTLVEVISEAGGLTDRANEKSIKIIHSNGKFDIIDLSDIRSLSDPRAVLQNDDVIVIPQNKRAIRADKLQDFSVLSQPILLIFNTALIIYTLARH